MKASIEISMYPLDPNYSDFISDYIERLKGYSDIEVRGNTMSTQVFGDYDRLMEIFTIENKKSLETHPAMVIVSKIVNADLRS
jgi:uncharacterized protein YqgV (UPF0045/DUF77 family)